VKPHPLLQGFECHMANRKKEPGKENSSARTKVALMGTKMEFITITPLPFPWLLRFLLSPPKPKKWKKEKK
jgi:hypothetical protein